MFNICSLILCSGQNIGELLLPLSLAWRFNTNISITEVEQAEQNQAPHSFPKDLPVLSLLPAYPWPAPAPPPRLLSFSHHRFSWFLKYTDLFSFPQGLCTYSTLCLNTLDPLCSTEPPCPSNLRVCVVSPAAFLDQHMLISSSLPPSSHLPHYYNYHIL